MSAEAPLAQRMRDAADILEAASERMAWPKSAPWQPDDLRREALHVEDEDREKSEQDPLVRELARDLEKQYFDLTRKEFVGRSDDYWLEPARTIIENGWGKP
jgi:hypothetical protein